eukprot:248850-Pelagomonas_calceolata.AAC.1
MKVKLREVQQAEKEDKSRKQKESRIRVLTACMLAQFNRSDRPEFQTFNNKQSQHCQPSSK